MYLADNDTLCHILLYMNTVPFTIDEDIEEMKDPDYVEDD